MGKKQTKNLQVDQPNQSQIGCFTNLYNSEEKVEIIQETNSKELDRAAPQKNMRSKDIPAEKIRDFSFITPKKENTFGQLLRNAPSPLQFNEDGCQKSARGENTPTRFTPQVNNIGDMLH